MTTIEAEGYNGQVRFDGQFVTITRKGFMARATLGKGEKRIPVASITAVQWKPAGPVTNGFIQFTVPGGNEVRSKFGRQTIDARRDENSVMFTMRQARAFNALRSAIEHGITQGAGTARAVVSDLPTQLANLAALHRSGALSEVEYSSAKAKLISASEDVVPVTSTAPSVRRRSGLSSRRHLS